MRDGEFTALLAAIRKTTPQLNIGTIAKHVAKTLKKPISESEEILETLRELSVTHLMADVSVDQFAQDVVSAMARQRVVRPGFNRVAFEKRLVALLNVGPLIVSSKAHNIKHEYEKVFGSARVLTDIRPVFGQTEADVAGVMVTHTLKLIYRVELGEYREIYIAMDNADLVSLRKVLDRADLKKKHLEEIIQKAALPYFESK